MEFNGLLYIVALVGTGFGWRAFAGLRPNRDDQVALIRTMRIAMFALLAFADMVLLILIAGTLL